MTIQTRYYSNLGILSSSQQQKLFHASVMVVGCGGIGGHIINQLVRLGVGHLHLVDYDRFEESNLNRQLFSTMSTIGKWKVDVLADAVKQMNPDCSITVHRTRIEALDNSIFDDIQFLIDAVDQPQTKVYLNHLSTNHNIPLLHGSCAGWYAQVGWIEPNCLLLEELYEDQMSGLEQDLLNPPFTPAMTASVMVSEFVKYVCNIPPITTNRFTLIDLRSLSMMSSDTEVLDG